MSILIKGMEMPQDIREAIIITRDGKARRIRAGRIIIEGSVEETNVAFELPPHGDLIDREAALYALCEAVHNVDGEIPCANQIVSCTWKKTRVQEFAEKILAIPTIIEEEVDEQ